jgi:stage II sporulation protein M
MKKNKSKEKKIERKEIVIKKDEIRGEANIFLESYKFVLGSKNFIFASAFIFLCFFGLAFIIYPSPTILEMIKKMVEELLAKTANFGFLEMFWFIFLNNLQASFFSMAFGVFFGIFPLLVLIFNGYFSGFVSYLATRSSGWGSLFSLVPHGIFELPAIFISTALGFRAGFFVFRKEKVSFLEILYSCLKAFVFIVFPLLFVAAFIEAGLILFFS